MSVGGWRGGLAASANDLKKASGGLSKFDAALDAVAQLNAKRFELFHDHATRKVLPLIRSMLAQNYAASGLGTAPSNQKNPKRYKKGALYQYSVTLADVIALGSLNDIANTFTPGGIFIRMGRGADSHIYAAAGVFRYGGVHGTREAIMSEAGAHGVGSKLGMGGERQKRRIKKAAMRLAKHGVKTAAGVTYMQPRPPFFKLSYSQVMEISSAYQSAFVNIVNANLSAKKRA